MRPKLQSLTIRIICKDKLVTVCGNVWLFETIHSNTILNTYCLKYLKRRFYPGEGVLPNRQFSHALPTSRFQEEKSSKPKPQTARKSSQVSPGSGVSHQTQVGVILVAFTCISCVQYATVGSKLQIALFSIGFQN